MAGLVPRLSGLVSGPLECQLVRVEWRGWIGLQQAIDPAPVHQVGADQASEGERAVHRPLRGLRQAQQQEAMSATAI